VTTGRTDGRAESEHYNLNSQGTAATAESKSCQIHAILLALIVLTTCPPRAYARHLAKLLLLAFLCLPGVDELLCLSWYDRQPSAIQTTGIKITEHLPYFVAMIVLFQKFDNRMWATVTWICRALVS
jgi:hypothetical protein